MSCDLSVAKFMKVKKTIQIISFQNWYQDSILRVTERFFAAVRIEIYTKSQVSRDLFECSVQMPASRTL